MRVHTGLLGTPTASQHNVSDSEKLSQFVLVLLAQAGFEPPIFGSDALPTEPPRHLDELGADQPATRAT